MKATVPTIAPLLRSDVQGTLLAVLLLHPDREFTLTELVRRSGSTMPTLSREVDRLVVSGFARERRSGRNRYISAEPAHPLHRPVRQIVEYAYGPLSVLPDALEGVPGIAEAYLYGSWAARYAGREGPEPADVDVLLIGRPDRTKVFAAEARARALLDRDVNIQTLSTESWQSVTDPFVATVRSRPMIRLQLETGA